MRDPYEVLEIGKNASMDEVKAAYKKMIKKYHPDQYQNNPLADLAQEKLKEVNEAYEQICAQKGNGNSAYGNTSSYSYGGGASYSGSGYSGGTDYNAVRNYIDMGNLDAAATILSNATDRNAEWHFLSGMVAYRRGWYDQSQSLIQQACNMDPNNFEYRRNLEALRGGGFRQSNPYGNANYNNMSADDIFCRACQAYMCLDCCCDCF